MRKIAYGCHHVHFRLRLQHTWTVGFLYASPPYSNSGVSVEYGSSIILGAVGSLMPKGFGRQIPNMRLGRPEDGQMRTSASGLIQRGSIGAGGVPF
jgi:hypothetical protein